LASLKNKSKGLVFSAGANRIAPGLTRKGDVSKYDIGLGDVACGGQLDVSTSSGHATSCLTALQVDLLFGLPTWCQELSKRDSMKAAAMAVLLGGNSSTGRSSGRPRNGFAMTVTRTVRQDVLGKKALGSRWSKEEAR